MQLRGYDHPENSADREGLSVCQSFMQGSQGKSRDPQQKNTLFQFRLRMFVITWMEGSLTSTYVAFFSSP